MLERIEAGRINEGRAMEMVFPDRAPLRKEVA